MEPTERPIDGLVRRLYLNATGPEVEQAGSFGAASIGGPPGGRVEQDLVEFVRGKASSGGAAAFVVAHHHSAFGGIDPIEHPEEGHRTELDVEPALCGEYIDAGRVLELPQAGYGLPYPPFVLTYLVGREGQGADLG